MTLLEDARETLARAIALRIILDREDDNAMGVWSRQTAAHLDLGSTDRVYELLAEMAGGVEIPDDERAGFRLGYAAGRRLAAGRGPRWRDSVQFELDALIDLHHITLGHIS